MRMLDFGEQNKKETQSYIPPQIGCSHFLHIPAHVNPHAAGQPGLVPYGHHIAY
jgi:hypothetical protein